MYSSNQLQRPQRPKLQSYGPYESTSPSTSSTSSPMSLFGSSRALHSILGGPTQSLHAPALGSPMVSPGPRPLPSAPEQGIHAQLSPSIPNRPTKKRGRDDYEDDTSMDMNTDMDDSYMIVPEEHTGYQTPKRLRRAPLDLPLGLQTSDFNTLQTPSLAMDADQMDEELPPDQITYGISPMQMHTAQRFQHNGDLPQWSSTQGNHQRVDNVFNNLNFSLLESDSYAQQRRLGQGLAMS